MTTNQGKVAELRHLAAPLGHTVVQDARGYPEIQADTLEEVARDGAKLLLASGPKAPFLLEDSGLFVSALRGFPGVFSRHALDTIGVPGLLRLLVDVELESRGATFQTYLVYVDGAGNVHGFEGSCKGRIAERAAGRNGFGFDPLFVPDGQPGTPQTFAEMAPEGKAALSHRAKAVRAFLAHLSKSAKT